MISDMSAELVARKVMCRVLQAEWSRDQSGSVRLNALKWHRQRQVNSTGSKVGQRAVEKVVKWWVVVESM